MTELLRIGAFFDGTGNNMWNDLAIEDGSQTNVAKLYKLYKAQNYKFLYEEGVGTEAYKEGGATLSEETISDIRNGDIRIGDLYNGDAMAFGSTAKDHVENMLVKIKHIIKDNPDKEIVIDVYGFSRGAAEARDFINEVNEICTNVDGKSVVGFVGLFDTVASIGLSGDYDFELNLNLDKDSAETIFHIKAKDEMRANFPSESFKLSDGPNITQITLPGVHSDIGGGYGALDLTKTLVVEDTRRFDVLHSDEEMQGRIAELEAEVQALEAGSPGVDYELMCKVTQSIEISDTYELESVIVEHHEIEYGLSNQALNKMYNQMKVSGIDLPELSSLDQVVFPGDGESYSLWKAPSEPYDVEKYIHVSASDTWYGGTVTDWIAHHEEWSLDGLRDTHYNDSDKSEIELLMLTSEDKTILYKERSEVYSIFGITEDHLSVLDDYSEKFAEHRAEFLYLHLNPDERFVPDEFGASDSTAYIDYITGQEYRGEHIADIDEVVFGSNAGEEIRLDQEWHSFLTSGNQIVYGKNGDDVIFTGEGNDSLYGGKGNDTYIYTSGEGNDTILDIDGLGKIVFDETELKGGDELSKGLYKSSDGKFTYAFMPGVGGFGTLVINQCIYVENFKNGNLGISLGDIQPEDPETTNQIIGTNDHDRTDSGIGILEGEDTSDHILGLAGDDVIYGYGNVDLIEGGLGSDIIIGGYGTDVLHAGDAVDVTNVIFSDLQTAGNTHDWLGGGEGDDYLYGSNGSDALVGGRGKDYIYGGAGDDYILGDSEEEPQDHTWIDTWINDSVVVANGTRNPVGSDDDVLIGGAGNDQIWGQFGDDIISGGIGDDGISGDMVGTGGSDLSGEFHGNDTIYGGSGDDGITGDGGNDLLVGGDGDDYLHGDFWSVILEGKGLLLPAEYHGEDTLYGGDGDDFMVGGAKDDALYGGDGEDTLYGDDETTGLTYDAHGDDYLDGGAGNDLLFGDGGNDTLYGGAGDDELQGDCLNIDSQYHGDDILDGGEGNDLLLGYGGNDTLYGGAGDDELQGDGLNIDSQYHGDDILDGGAGADVLWGFGGSDTLIGGDGSDHLFGGEGADTFTFKNGDGVDFIHDGDADDTVCIQTANEVSASINADNSLLILTYGEGDVIYINGGTSTKINKFEFCDGKILTKDELLDMALTEDVDIHLDEAGEAIGGSGNDTLSGSEGDDQLYGLNGNDFLDGGAGNDYLDGGTGNDILVGHGGNDILLGGSGNDIYFYSSNDGVDEISDGSGFDIVVFTDVTSESVIYSVEGDDLVVTIDNDNRLIIRGWEINSSVDALVFSDRSTIAIEKIMEEQANGEYFDTNNEGDLISGGSGNDLFNIAGESVNVDGGDGDDTYVVMRDTINYHLTDNGGTDTLVFYDALSLDDLILNQQNGDLTIQSGDSKVTVQDWAQNRIERFKFSDGSLAYSAQIMQAINVAPVVSNPIPDRTTANGFGFLYTIPEDRITDPDIDDVLVFSATLEDGSTLPEWLSFDPSTRTIAGLPDAGQIGAYDIKITATDHNGLSVGDTFTLNVVEASEKIPVVNIRMDSYYIVHSDLSEFGISGKYSEYVGDVNGDGFDDIIVGSGGYDGPAYSPGISLVYGAGSMLTEESVRKSEFVHSAYLDETISISSLGDIDGDGYADIAVQRGNRGYRDTPYDNNTHILYGSADGFAELTYMADLSGVESTVMDGEWIKAISDAGDVNGDGLNDFILNERLVLGRSDRFGATVDVATLDGFYLNGNSYGNSYSIGDINGDGADDLLTSFFDPQKGVHTTRILLGRTGLELESESALYAQGNWFDVIEDPELINTLLSATGVGDFNGDGVEDFVLWSMSSAYDYTAYVVMGNENGFNGAVDLAALDGINGFKIDDIITDSFWPWSNPVDISAGDIDGDGKSDIAISVMGGSGTSYDTTHIIFGSETQVQAVFSPEQLDGNNGFNVLMWSSGHNATSLDGDVDGDGFADLVRGMPGSINCTCGGDQAFNVLYGDDFRNKSDFLGSEGTDSLLIDANGSFYTFGGDDIVDILNSATSIYLNTGDGDDTINFGKGGDYDAPGKYFVNAGSGNDIINIDMSGYNGVQFHRIIYNLGGGSGNDTYSINPFNSLASIININDIGGSNSLVIGLSASKYSPSLSYGSLKITFENSELEVHLENFDSDNVLGGPRDIDTFVFSDITYSYEEFVALGFDLEGTMGDDIIHGTSVVDRITGHAGDDTLNGGLGDDELDGGKGADNLYGGEGDDRYIFRKGDGIDYIHDDEGANIIQLLDVELGRGFQSPVRHIEY